MITQPAHSRQNLTGATRRRACSLLAAAFLSALAWGAQPLALRATIDENSEAFQGLMSELIDPDLKQGFVLREDTWSGELPKGETKAIAHQLFKGNDYRFYLGTELKNAKLSVHVYDQDGNLVDSGSWQKALTGGCSAGVSVRPTRTGTYFLIVKVEQSSEPRTAWGLIYAYK